MGLIPPVGFKQMSKCKARAGPGTGLREGSKAVLGIVSAHAQLILRPMAQCACPTLREPHSAEKTPSFLTGIFSQDCGHHFFLRASFSLQETEQL